MLTNTSSTQYAVARGTDIISDGYSTPEIAAQQAQHLSEVMVSVGLEPDLHVVEVTVKTTIGKPKPYTPPTPATEPAEAPAQGEPAPPVTEPTHDPATAAEPPTTP